MPEINALTRQKVTSVSIDLGDDDSLTIDFDRNRITPAWMREADRRDKDQDPFSIPKTLSDVIVAWDVTDEGQEFPPTPDNIARLSYPAQAKLLEAITLAAIPSSEEGEASSGLSSPSPPEAPQDSGKPSPERPQTPQNGPVPSPSPELSASPSPT